MDWKDKLGALIPEDYSPEPAEKVPDNRGTKQQLRVELDKRKGKSATLITGFEGSEEDLKELAKLLKNHCAAGGSQRNGEILIQGDFRQKVAEILSKMGHKVRKINF